MHSSTLEASDKVSRETIMRSEEPSLKIEKVEKMFIQFWKSGILEKQHTLVCDEPLAFKEEISEKGVILNEKFD